MSTILTRNQLKNRMLSYVAMQHARPPLTPPDIIRQDLHSPMTTDTQLMSSSRRYKSDAHPVQTIRAGFRKLNKVAAPLFVVLLVLTTSPTALHADPLLTYPIRIGDHVIRAELANTPETRRTGLMFRTKLADASGMIFVFPAERRISMWMKNTFVPLSVAFIDANGRIINIESMQPESERIHSSKAPARYALEMKQGWFRKHGVKAGDQVTGLERLPAPQ